MTDRLTIALAQLNPTVGDFAGNEARILAAYRRGVEAGVSLVSRFRWPGIAVLAVAAWLLHLIWWTIPFLQEAGLLVWIAAMVLALAVTAFGGFPRRLPGLRGERKRWSAASRSQRGSSTTVAPWAAYRFLHVRGHEHEGLEHHGHHGWLEQHYERIMGRLLDDAGWARFRTLMADFGVA